MRMWPRGRLIVVVIVRLSAIVSMLVSVVGVTDDRSRQRFGRIGLYRVGRSAIATDAYRRCHRERPEGGMTGYAKRRSKSESGLESVGGHDHGELNEDEGANGSRRCGVRDPGPVGRDDALNNPTQTTRRRQPGARNPAHKKTHPGSTEAGFSLSR